MAAIDNVFLSQQLLHLEKTLYHKKRPKNKARILIPTDFNIPRGAKSVAYDTYDEYGQAEILGGDPTDIPLIGMKAVRSTAPVKTLVDGYVISLEDLEAAQESGIPLDSMLPEKARNILLTKEDTLAYAGSSDHGLGGFNYSGLDNAVVATVSGATTWADKLLAGDGAFAVIADIAEAANDIMNNVGENEEMYPDTLILPPVQYGAIARQPMPGNPATTILKYILETDPHIKNVTSWAKMTTSGTGSSAQFLLYKRNPDTVRMRIAMDVEQLPPQLKGLAHLVILRSKFGGVEWYQPLSGHRRYGI